MFYWWHCIQFCLMRLLRMIVRIFMLLSLTVAILQLNCMTTMKMYWLAFFFDSQCIYFRAAIGSSMVLLPTVIIVQQHFLKHRPLAASVSSIGFSVGSMTSAPMIRALLDAYGWRGTLLMLAAIVLNCCIFASF